MHQSNKQLCPYRLFATNGALFFLTILLNFKAVYTWKVVYQVESFICFLIGSFILANIICVYLWAVPTLWAVYEKKIKFHPFRRGIRKFMLFIFFLIAEGFIVYAISDWIQDLIKFDFQAKTEIIILAIELVLGLLFMIVTKLKIWIKERQRKHRMLKFKATTNCDERA